jgi:hypothetical protein
MLKFIYYWVGVMLSIPIILWAAITSLLVWNADYFDEMCEGVFGKLDKTRDL